MLSTACEGGCSPSYLLPRRQEIDSSLPSVVISLVPLVATFTLVSITTSRRLYPLLSSGLAGDREALPTTSPAAQKWFKPARPSKYRKAAGLVFSITIGLTAVLAELILCEILDFLNPYSRSIAMKASITILLTLLVIVTPLLEIHSIITGSGLGSYTESTSSHRRRSRSLFVAIYFFGWLFLFWWIGNAIPGTHFAEAYVSARQSLAEAALERIGVVGVCLLASLSGFASTSALWQAFTSKNRLITEEDISRKQLGLESTEDMLAAKRSRLRALDRKLSETPSFENSGLFTKLVGSIRGNPDLQERRTLQLEISGLETMRLTLSTSINILRSRREAQLTSKTVWGRFMTLTSMLFALYCLYRVPATVFHFFKRWVFDHYSTPANHTISHSDPITYFLSLLATHWDPNINRASWATTISFLLSGVIIFLSFQQVVNTFHFLLRMSPPSSKTLLAHLHANRALILSQIAATYVISSVLMLRSSLPDDIGGAIVEALGAPIERAWLESWFETWFLGGCLVTLLGLVGARCILGRWEDDDLHDEDTLEGKLS